MLSERGNTFVELGEGEIKLDSERPAVALPNEAEVIIRVFWSKPERCKVVYDKQRDCIYIAPIRDREHSETRDIEILLPLTLHEAICVVIYDNGNKPMKPRQILQEIISRDLYRKKNGSFPDITQIHARISNYSKLFERKDEGILLTDEGIELAKKAKAKAGLP